MPELLSRFQYPLEWNMQRQPVRPADLRVLDFDKTFDFETVWNDAIQINPQCVLLVGPPLYQTAAWLQTNCEIYSNFGERLSVQVHELDRACLTIINTSKTIDTLEIRNAAGSWFIPVNLPDTAFNNQKVIVTISKNHPISWLQQWIQYHNRVHNIDGLLLYNNQSTIYTSVELEQALQGHGMTVKVIDYDVPFGTMGGGLWEWQGRKGTFLPWDSDFAQYVMLEHAKWRYLYCAKLAINADTDELLLLDNITLDKFADYCETSSNSVWLYKGTWIEPVDSATGVVANMVEFDNRRFENYWHTAYSNQRGIGVKWMLNPRKNLNYQWMLHRTTGPHMHTDEISFAHYLAMNTSWSWKRDNFVGNRSSLVEMSNLKKNLHTAFKTGV
jgi:hypothetical protein